MRFAAIEVGGRIGVATLDGARWVALFRDDASYPGDLDDVIARRSDGLGAAHAALRYVER